MIVGIVVFLITLLSSDAMAIECAYSLSVAEEGEDSDIMPRGNCGEIEDDDFLILRKGIADRLYFHEDGLAIITVFGGVDRISVYYVARSGRIVRAHFSDNTADLFYEGMARTVRKGKIGFIDHDLETVISPAYDFAFPFDGGYAIVCNECGPDPDDEYGEHPEIVGGVWGVIDGRGLEVIPVRLSRDKLVNDEKFMTLFQGPVYLGE